MGSLLFRKIDKTIEYFIFSLLSLMSIVIFLQVLFRYVIKYSLPWSEELARYLFVWLSLMGAAAGVKKNAHFGVDMVVKKLKPRSQHILKIVGSWFILCFLGVVLFEGFQLTIRNWTQYSPAMRIPMSFPYAAIPFSSFIMSMYVIKEIISSLKKE